MTSTETRQYSDGSISKASVNKEYVRDEAGEVTGTIVTTTVSTISADGEYGSSSQTVESCDAGGGKCSEVSSTYEDSDTIDEYINPDAENPVVVTQEAADGVLRTRGAAVTVVQEWTPPVADDDAMDPNRISLVMLVDSDLADHYLIVAAMRVTEAQPEVRPDLSNPLEAAPLPGGGGCNNLC